MAGYIIIGLTVVIIFVVALSKRCRNSRRTGDGADAGSGWSFFGDSGNSDSGTHHSHHDGSHHSGFDGGGHDGGGHGGDGGGGDGGGGH